MMRLCAFPFQCVQLSVSSLCAGLFLWATAGETDIVSHGSPRAPAINDDNLNLETLVFAEAARLDKLRKSPI